MLDFIIVSLANAYSDDQTILQAMGYNTGFNTLKCGTKSGIALVFHPFDK